MSTCNHLAMPYAQLFLGKSPDDLTYEDIELFFSTARSESDKLEFKSYGSDPNDQRRVSHKDKQNAIYRTICGMLNSMGGLIIWGAPVGKEVDSQKEKQFVGDLSPVTKRIEKDAFISSVSDMVTPTPAQIRFHPLQKDGHFVYLIEVDPSPYSPHQFQDVYLMRLDGQTRPAPHQYIEALFRKVTFPNLEGYVKLRKISATEQRGYIINEVELLVLIFNLSALQNEENIFFHLETSLGSFNRSLDYVLVDEPQNIRKFNVQPVLFHKAPYIYANAVYVSESSLLRNHYKLEIHLSFGGKKSPLKLSRYVFNLRADPENDTVGSVVEKEEHQFYSESPGWKSFSTEDQIEAILYKSNQLDG